MLRNKIRKIYCNVYNHTNHRASHKLFGLTPCCLLYFWIQTCIRHHFYFIVIINSWTSFWCITQISIWREKLKKLKKERLTIKWLWTGAIAEVKKNDWENIIAFWKKSKRSKALDNKCHAFENFAVFTFI